jgi:hypothetical protein
MMTTTATTTDRISLRRATGRAAEADELQGRVDAGAVDVGPDGRAYLRVRDDAGDWLWLVVGPETQTPR